MRKLALILTTLTALASTMMVRADVLFNDFSQSFDYVANGILGDTNWDGIYLRQGDILGSVGTSGVASTPTANTTTFPGILGLQNIAGNWSGANNDGFFIYKVVQGDFDVSVESVPGMFSGGIGLDNRANNFFGLQVRLVNTNNTGTPFSTTVSNRVENSLRLWRFSEFGLDGQIRMSTNSGGADNQASFPSPSQAYFSTDTNSTRFFRITRAGNTFSFYEKTNSGDDWFLITNANASGGYVPTNGAVQRPDFAGQNLEVGIAQAAFSGASRDALFQNFQLITTNYTMFPPMPTGPSGLHTTAVNTGGSLSLAWTLGTPGDNSLVVVSRNNFQHNPSQGLTYFADANNAYGDTNTMLGGNNEFVVYSGSATSVTVTNLGANNINYHFAVFEYNPNAGSPIYNTLAPNTNTFAGPGVITSAFLTTTSTNIPVGGAASAHLIASFSTGETSDQTVNSTFGSGDPTVFTVDTFGTVSAVTNGTAALTATFGAFNLSTNISVHTPVFTDSFAETHAYLTSGLVGSSWDGMYLNFGDVPGGTNGTDGNGLTSILDSQITDTNGLVMASSGCTWSGSADDGPFLFKVIPGSINAVSGDFEVSVHINSMTVLNGQVAGLMARVYNTANGGPGPGGSENHVEYWKVQNGTTSVRRTSSNGTSTTLATGPAAGDTWLLIQRVNSTNFYFFEKSTAAAAWILTTNVTLLNASNNAPMQVGMAEQANLGGTVQTTFNSAMVDAAGIATAFTPPPAVASVSNSLNSDLTITISYAVPGTNADGSAIRTVVVMKDGSPVSAQPYTGMALAGNTAFGDPANNLGSGNYVVFRSGSGTFETNESFTVSNLTPGHTYYYAVYSFVSLGTTRTFNENATTSNNSVTDGALQFLQILPTPPIPRNGIGTIQAIGHFTGGATLNVSPFATITITNLTGVVKLSAGILTGISNGTATVTLVYQGVTNTSQITVQDGTFTDEFNVNHDYLASGTSGSGWDGVYSPNGLTGVAINPIPGSTYVPDTTTPGEGAIVADANISTNGMLKIVTSGNGWEGADAAGLFLFKYVPGDFQMAVHIAQIDGYIGQANPGNLASRASWPAATTAAME
jgi:hypothetical protein